MPAPACFEASALRLRAFLVESFLITMSQLKWHLKEKLFKIILSKIGQYTCYSVSQDSTVYFTGLFTVYTYFTCWLGYSQLGDKLPKTKDAVLYPDGSQALRKGPV